MANTLAHASSEPETFTTLTWAGTGGGHLPRALTREVGCALLG